METLSDFNARHSGTKAAPNFPTVQVSGPLKIPTLKRGGRSSSALGSMQFYPRPSLKSSTIRAFGLARSEIMDRCRHAATRTGYLFARSDWD
jgi:hypothetical protein